MKIAIVTTTVRENRNSIKVANWVLENAKNFEDDQVSFELVDLKDFKLPFLGTTPNEEEGIAIKTWKDKMNSFDGFIFVTAEYNRAASGVFKNALDYLNAEIKEKVVSFVGYGGLGAARSIEQLRVTLATTSTATTGIAVNLLINTDFVNMSEFEPKDYQVKALHNVFNESIRWNKALKTMRETK